MSRSSSSSIFESLTDKQREALSLASDGLTSKEIARELGISPHSVDKRIDTIRAQMGYLPRSRLVREFRTWETRCQSVTGHSSPLTPFAANSSKTMSQPVGETLLFSDAVLFNGHAEWKREQTWLRPGIKPSELSIGWRLLFISVASFAVAAAFILTAASVDVLIDLLN